MKKRVLILLACALSISLLATDRNACASGSVSFPEGDIFAPLLADPKQEQAYLSVHEAEIRGVGNFTVASGAYNLDFGLTRWPGNETGGGWQLSLKGGVFSIFNLDSPSFDLINTDFTIGLHLTHRSGGHSQRFRYYHQSTHVGDEFLLSEFYPNNTRINFSYEGIEAVYSYEWQRLRLYLGLVYLVHVEPSDLERIGGQAGLEYRGSTRFLGGRTLGGIDIKGDAHHDNKLSVSLKAGVEYGKPGPGNRRIRVMLEAYDGYVPFGQFYDLESTSFGLGLYMLF